LQMGGKKQSNATWERERKRKEGKSQKKLSGGDRKSPGHRNTHNQSRPKFGIDKKTYRIQKQGKIQEKKGGGQGPQLEAYRKKLYKTLEETTNEVEKTWRGEKKKNRLKTVPNSAGKQKKLIREKSSVNSGEERTTRRNTWKKGYSRHRKIRGGT